MNNNHSTITANHAFEERKRYVLAFNDTMLKIWQEQITMLDVIDTRQLLASPKALPVRADGRFFEVGLSQMFLEYGLGKTTEQVGRRLVAIPGTFRANESRVEFIPTMPSAAEIVLKETSVVRRNESVAGGSPRNTIHR